jgi:phospholipid/cholesterol/gamma-HCH transport system substrate-binding protein
VVVDRHDPPYEVAGAVLLVVVAVAAGLIYLQFRGDLIRTTPLTLLA